MSVALIDEPRFGSNLKVHSLNSGSWFIDHFGQIFLVALGDRSNEKRVICVGDYCKPFIANVSLSHLEIDRVLMPGTTLKIVQTNNLNGGR